MKLNILSWLFWWFGDKEDPRPALFYPTDNWITDEKEAQAYIGDQLNKGDYQ